MEPRDNGLAEKMQRLLRSRSLSVPPTIRFPNFNYENYTSDSIENIDEQIRRHHFRLPYLDENDEDSNDLDPDFISDSDTVGETKLLRYYIDRKEYGTRFTPRMYTCECDRSLPRSLPWIHCYVSLDVAEKIQKNTANEMEHPNNKLFGSDENVENDCDLDTDLEKMYGDVTAPYNVSDECSEILSQWRADSSTNTTIEYKTAFRRRAEPDDVSRDKKRKFEFAINYNYSQTGGPKQVRLPYKLLLEDEGLPTDYFQNDRDELRMIEAGSLRLLRERQSEVDEGFQERNNQRHEEE